MLSLHRTGVISMRLHQNKRRSSARSRHVPHPRSHALARLVSYSPLARRPVGRAPQHAHGVLQVGQHTLRHERLVLVPEGHRAAARRRLAPIKALGVALIRGNNSIKRRLARTKKQARPHAIADRHDVPSVDHEIQGQHRQARVDVSHQKTRVAGHRTMNSRMSE